MKKMKRYNYCYRALRTLVFLTVSKELVYYLFENPRLNFDEYVSLLFSYGDDIGLKTNEIRLILKKFFQQVLNGIYK